MPDFPRYESRESINTGAPSNALREKVGVGPDVGPVIVEGLSKIAQGFATTLDRSQRNTAELNFKKGMLDIMNRAENDPDYNNSKEYFKEIEKLKGESIKGLSFGPTKHELSTDFDLQAKVAGIKIDNLYKKKIIDLGRATALESLDLEIENPVEGWEDRIKRNINNQVESQLISRDDAYKLEKKYIETGRYNVFLNDADSGDPAEARKKLKENSYGLNRKQIKEATSYIDASEARFDEEEKQMRLDTANQAGEFLARGELTSEMVDSMVFDGRMDAELGSSFSLALAGPDKWEQLAPQTSTHYKDPSAKAVFFMNAIANLPESDSEGRVKIIKSALDNFNDKKMDKDDMAFILRAANGLSTDPDNPVWGRLRMAMASAGMIGVGGEMEASGEVAGKAPMLAGTKETKEFFAGAIKRFKDTWDFESDPVEVMDQAKIETWKEKNPEGADWETGTIIPMYGRNWEIVYWNEDGSPHLEEA